MVVQLLVHLAHREQPYDAEVIPPLRESLERLLANRAASLANVRPLFGQGRA